MTTMNTSQSPIDGTILNAIRLECTFANHYKYYELTLHAQEVDTIMNYTVKARYGRIGGVGRTFIVYDGPSRKSAESAMEDKQKEKLSHGYHIVAAQNTAHAAAPGAKSFTTSESHLKTPSVPPSISHILPMRAHDVVDMNHMKQLLEDPNYCVQEKLASGGIRALVQIAGHDGHLEVFGVQKIGDELRLIDKTKALPDHLARVRLPDFKGTLLDTFIVPAGVSVATLSLNKTESRIVTDNVTIFIFDIVKLRDIDLTGKPLKERLQILEHNLGASLTYRNHHTKQYLTIMPTARTKEEKQLFYERVMQSNRKHRRTINDVSGGDTIFKNLLSHYSPGARPAGAWYIFRQSLLQKHLQAQHTQTSKTQSVTKGKRNTTSNNTPKKSNTYFTQVGAIVFRQIRM